MVFTSNISPHSFPEIRHYSIVEQLYVGSRTAVYRAIHEPQGDPVVIKMLQCDYPSFSELVQFRNQYAITKDLPIPGIIHPLGLEPLGRGYALVMEDWGGVALGQYIQQESLDLTAVLAIALQLSNILHDLGQHRVVHKDIKPANILIQPESNQVKLIDFSLASLLPKEMQEVQSANTLEGTLAYLAPEQTGRMNRGIDYRTDFYALGVTLYQLLAGKLPFEADDPLELIHCHIAKVPLSVDRVNPDVPAIVAAIVSKLMAKNAEDRYQSALGLKHDLAECLTQWQATGAIAEFELGQHDLSDRFLIPEKLYGREQEVQTLLQAFDRISMGRSELMLVAGFSGIGKTAVVNEVHKPITQQKGYFIKGKFDQFNHNIPLFAFVQAFRNLIGQLLSESDAQLAQWKANILEAVGENGQVLIDLIPELTQIIGSQPAVPELPGEAAQNRFNRLFQNFMQVFTKVEHPLVIFIDDLQWADSASLGLMQSLLTEAQSQYLLVLGAYRDNEVFPGHPFLLTVKALEDADVNLKILTLGSLSADSLNSLIADTFRASHSIVQPLTNLVMQKTQGNPFFTTQFLKALHQDGLITFNREAGHWQCDLVQVQDAALTDDVVEFMALQLQKLPMATQEQLKFAACIGAKFDLKTLAIVSEQDEIQVAFALWSALQEGLIVPESKIYKFYLNRDQSQDYQSWSEEISEQIQYRFFHDRVQQAAYSLIPEDEKQATHLKMGQLLQSRLSAAEREEKLFDIVSHLNSGRGLLSQRVERESLIQLNLVALEKAKKATAYGVAQDLVMVGLELLSEDAWQNQYELSLKLHQMAADVACLQGDFEEASAQIQQVLDSAQTILDKVPVYQVQIRVLAAQNQFAEAIAVAAQAVTELGVEFPVDITPSLSQKALQDVAMELEGKVIEDLVNLPVMTDPPLVAVMELLGVSIPMVFTTEPALLPFVCTKIVSLSLQFGNAPVSSAGYTVYGLVLMAGLGEVERGYRFGKMALALIGKLNTQAYRCLTILHFSNCLQHRKEPVVSTLSLLMQGYLAGIQTGDFLYAGYCINIYCDHLFYCGKELSVIQAELDQFCEAIGSFKQDNALIYLQMKHEFLRQLVEITERPTLLIGDAYDEMKMFPQYLQTNELLGLGFAYTYKLMLAYLLSDYSHALDYLNELSRYLGAMAGFLHVAAVYFYGGLTYLTVAGEKSGDEQLRLLELAEQYQISLSTWAADAPMNYQHKVDLLTAEKGRVLGNLSEAIDGYERAIAGAKANGFGQEEALANELAAKFYLDWNKPKLAQEYLTNAYYGYARWGAKAKVQDLERRYPYLLAPILQQQMALSATETLFAHTSLATSQAADSQSSSSGSTSISDTLDLATVLKASQTLSSEIQLDRLLVTLLHTVLENAGADTGALLMPHDHEWFVEAVAAIDQPTRVQSIALSSSTEVPHALINAVKRNQQPVVVVDASVHPTLATDAYVLQHQPKSLLCAPILQQGKLLAMVYLENHVTIGAFTSDRIELLHLLCTQAAISLENARLYRQSQESQQILQLVFDTLPQRVFWKDLNLCYLGCNLPFLQDAKLTKLDEILGKSDFELDWRASAEQYRADDAAVIHSGVPRLNFEETQVQGDGTILWVKTSKIPLRNAQGEIIGVFGSYEDITLMKMAENLLKQQKQDLEITLSELQNTQLQMVQSEKMASLGNLVAGVAHEINNPIGFLNGSINNAKDYVQDLLDYIALYQKHHPHASLPVQEKAEDMDLEFLSEDFPRLLDSMKGATDRITSISTSLRNFSRADTEYKVSANLHEGINSTLLILKYRLKANEHRPAIEVIQDYGDLPLVDCFPGQLNQVFMNILANAIDMFDEMAHDQSLNELKSHPQQIRIRTTTQEKQVQIQICDNGQGMTKEVSARIFDRLFTTKRVGKGTGLGLAIAHQIVVEKHGGSLDVQSELGQGTEFCIRLSISD